MRKARLLSVTLALISALCGLASAQSNGIAALSPGVISLYAGSANGCSGVVTPTPASPYDGCPPLNIKLGGVRSVVFDAAGNLYIADINDHRIRKITPAGGVSTVAGTGSITGITYASTGAQLGDNGPATSAIVDTPPALAIDANGSLYFTDYTTNRVRVVYQGNGSDTASTLIALENPGVTAQKGYIYTIAGTGQPGPSGDGGMASAATFANTANISSSNSSNGIALDSAGNVYITDGTNNTIREINAKTGIVATIAGTLASGGGFTGDGGLAVAALLNLPRGIAIDAAANIYIADSSNSRIRMINGPNTMASSTGLGRGYGPGIIHTIAGGGTGSSGVGPYGNLGTAAKVVNAVRNVSVDSAGNVYIAEAANYRVEKLDPNDILTLAAGNLNLTSGFPAIATLAAVTGLGGSSYGVNLGQPYAGVVNPTTGDLIVVDNTTGALYNVSASASVLAFGSQPTYVSSAAQNVTLSNVGSGALHLGGLSISGAGFSITTSGRTDCTAATVLQPGQSCQLSVLFTPVAASAATGTVTLTDDSLGTAGTTQTIALSGIGTTTTSTSTLVATPGVVSAGAAVVLKATVTAAAGAPVTAPTGTVSFLNGSTNLGSAALDPSGNATLPLSSLPVGSYTSLTASYAGDAVYLASTSASASLSVVSQGVSTTVLTASTQTATPGQSITLTVSVAAPGGAPSGVVTFYDGATALASNLPLTAGVATFSTANLAVGYHSLSAVYGGSAASTGSTSSSLGVLVSAAAYPVATLIPGTVNTLAGTANTKGSSGDGGTASAALLNIPDHIAFDASGNLYVSDSGNHTIREIIAVNGAIRSSSSIVLFAGAEGVPGSTGDGSAATAARLFGPQGMAFDAAGNLYLADTLNNVVRIVNAGTGKIATFAGTRTAGYTGDGGLATAATLNAPIDVAVDRLGNVYIADAGNNVIRVVAGSTGKIATFAGSGRFTSTAYPFGDGGLATAATFAGISGLAVDINLNLYIADSGNQVVRRVSVASGTIATVAGTPGSGGHIGDGSPATSARLLNPGALSINLAGNLTIADTGNSVVREIDAAGTIFTVAGTGVSGYSGDSGPSTSAQLASPVQAVSDTSGNLYVADSSTATIRVINGQASALNFPTQASGAAGSPLSLRVLNGGGTPLTLSAASFSSGVFSQLAQGSSDCTVSSLAQGGSCTLAVVANSATAGTFTGTLQLTDNANGNGASQQTAALSVQTVAVPSQSIAFAPLAAVTYGTAPIRLSATATSGLPVVFTVVSGPATLSGSTLTVTGAGNVVVQASQPGQPLVWAAASSVTQTLAVNKANLVVTAVSLSQSGGTAIQPLTYTILGFVNADTQASATTGQPSLTTAATAASPGGIYAITVTQGTISAANYGFTFVNGKLTISGTAQSIAFSALSPVTYGVSPISLSASATSNLPVSFAVLSGPATVIGSTLTVNGAGSIVIQATQPGNADPVTFVGYGAAVPAQQTLSVAKAPLALTVANASRVYGVANPAFGGTVNGTVGADVLTASYTTTATPASAPGSYAVTASVAGVNAASYQTTVVPGTLTVTQATPQFLLTATPGSISYGSSIVLTATFVSNLGSAPGGSFSFMSGATVLGIGTLTNGVATLTTKTLSPGALSVTFVYGGDSNYAGITSTPIGVTVVSPTTTGLSVTPSATNVGDAVTLAATVTATATGAGTPTGSITFFNGTASLGTVALSGASAQLVVTNLPLGISSITAQYSGAALFGVSTSAAVSATVSQPFAITLPASTVTITSGQTAQLQGAITANNAFAKPIAITCTGLPLNATCGLSTVSFTPTPSATSLPLNIQISTAPVKASLNRPAGGRAIFLASLGLGSLLLLALPRRRRHVALLTLLLCATLFGTSGCGSSSAATAPVPAGSSVVSITGTSGSTTVTTTFTLVVQ